MTLTVADLTKWCHARRACPEAMQWLATLDPLLSAYAAWRSCERGDWLLWVAGRVVEQRLLVQAACDCAESVLHLVPAGEDRPRVAIETTRRWCVGEATLGEVRHASAAADAASAASCASSCASYAADAAADADAASANGTTARIVRRRIRWRDVAAGIEAAQ